MNFHVPVVLKDLKKKKKNLFADFKSSMESSMEMLILLQVS